MAQMETFLKVWIRWDDKETDNPACWDWQSLLDMDSDNFQFVHHRTNELTDL